MSCSITRESVISNIKDKIVGNATSYKIEESSVFIPIGKNITNLKATQKVAEGKVESINKEYDSENFGKVVSSANTTEGTRIMIHPSNELIVGLKLKDADFERDLNYFNGDQALMEQEERESPLDNVKEKEFPTRQAVIKYLRSVTNPKFFKLVEKGNGWNAEVRTKYKNVESVVNALKNCE